MNLIKPPKLSAGDKLAAISLSWGGAAAYPDRYVLGKKRFEKAHGVTLVATRHALRDPAWLAANPKARADDLMEAFADPSIKGIISIIGGEDSIRLLPYIDFDVIAKNPKGFMGFSDTTISHFICMKAGLSSFYGPSLMGCYDENVEMFDYTVDAVQHALFSDQPIGEVKPSDLWTGKRLEWAVPENARIKRQRAKPLGPQFLRGKGTVRGPLLGGCIEVLDWLRGTALWPSLEMWEGAILFLETSEERPLAQEFRRWLRCLSALGVLERVDGILLGRPMCDPDIEQITQYDKALLEIVLGECELVDLPIVSQMDFGHSDPKMVLPFGAMAEIDCDQKVFRILESGVVA